MWVYPAPKAPPACRAPPAGATGLEEVPMYQVLAASAVFVVLIGQAILTGTPASAVADDPLVHPLPRCCQGFTYFPEIQRVVMYGGTGDVDVLVRHLAL